MLKDARQQRLSSKETCIHFAPNKSPVTDCVIGWLKELNDVIRTIKGKSARIFALCSASRE